MSNVRRLVIHVAVGQHAQVRPADVRLKKLRQRRLAADAIPDKLDMAWYCLFRNQFGQIVDVALDGIGGYLFRALLKQRTGMQQQDRFARVMGGDGLENLRLVVDHGERPIATGTKVLNAGELGGNDIVAIRRFAHEQQITGELHAVLAPQLVQRTQCFLTQMFRPRGIQADMGMRLQLEPADHIHHAGKRPVCLKHGGH